MARLVDTDLADPAWTAALDEAILEAKSRDLVPDTLHLYRRERPAITIGRFQRVEEVVDLEACRRAGVPVIRRSSGGGAIYTDEHQLIYGITLKGRGWTVEEGLERMAEPVVEAVRGSGVEAIFRPKNDVMAKTMNGGFRKISGCAQVRRRSAVLQHGTIIMSMDRGLAFRLLKVDEEVLELKGLKRAEDAVTSLQEIGAEVDLSMLKARLVSAFTDLIGEELVPDVPTQGEIKEATKLVASRYRNDEWNLHL